MEQLKSALEASEMRYNGEQERVAQELTSAWELIEKIKDSSRDKEDEIEKVLKANLMDKENELQGICEENEELHQRLENMLSSRANLELEKEIQRAKASLMDKEAEMQIILEENETLKMNIKKKEINC